MSKTGDFLWKLFCALVVFFYHRVDNANAATIADRSPYINSGSANSGLKDTKFITADWENIGKKPTTTTNYQTLLKRSSTLNLKLKTTVKLCDLPNQYVVSCSGYKVGFEWLTGGKISGKDATSNKVKTLEIPEYLKKDSLAETPDKDKIDALKYFFAQAGAKPDIKEECPSSSSTVKDSISKEDCERTKVEGGKTVAFDLLSILCSNPSDVVCATCDGGSVDDSLYQYDETSIVAGSWKFYTIADCYITDFTDQTGTYNYIETTSNPPIKHKFYYKPDIAAKQLVGTALPGQPK